jgi:hypothetical protein
MTFSSESLIRGTRGCVKRMRQNEKMKPAAASIGTILVHLFQPLGIEAEFLGHLDQLLRGFRILDGFDELPVPVGLVSIVVGWSSQHHFDECG